MSIKNKLTTIQIDQKTHKELVKIKAKLELEIGESLNMNRVVYAMAVEIMSDIEKKKKQLKLKI